MQTSDVVIVYLSRSSVTKEGYVQKEIRQALDVADEKREESIVLIPLRLEECVVPERIRRRYWVGLFEERGYEEPLQALRIKAREKTPGIYSSSHQ